MRNRIIANIVIGHNVVIIKIPSGKKVRIKKKVKFHLEEVPKIGFHLEEVPPNGSSTLYQIIALINYLFYT